GRTSRRPPPLTRNSTLLSNGQRRGLLPPARTRCLGRTWGRTLVRARALPVRSWPGPPPKAARGGRATPGLPAGSTARGAAQEMRSLTWDERFADRYEEWSAQMTADIAFYVELARAADGPLVELAVGNGRVAIPVAQATGQRVIGIDSSPAMLGQARARAAQAGVDLDLREGDMRDLALDEPAGLVYCPFPALLPLPAWADPRRPLQPLARPPPPPGR